MLATNGSRGQALMELRFAAQDDPEVVPPAMSLAAKLSQDHDELIEAIPVGAAGAHALQALAGNLSGSELRPLRIRLWREAIARDSNLDGAHMELARDLMFDAAKGTGLCADDGGRSCRDEIEGHARAL